MYELFTDDARKVMQLIISRLIEARWLAANDAAVSTFARRINDERRWQELPLLADALEPAGCTDRSLIDHCRLSDENPIAQNDLRSLVFVVRLVSESSRTGLALQTLAIRSAR